MNTINSSLDPSHYEVFFQSVIILTTQKLPLKLRRFESSKDLTNNYIRFKYREFTYSHYELDFAKWSKPNEDFYGEAYIDVVAFYIERLGGKDRTTWLTIVEQSKDSITPRLGKPPKIGEWNERWTGIGIKVGPDEAIGYDPEYYSNQVAQFIQATYDTVSKVNRIIGRIK